MSAASKAEDIRAAMLKPTLKTETVHLPRLGIDITLMEMDGTRLEQYESMIYRVGNSKVKSDFEHINAKIAVMSIVDVNGDLIFTPDDIEALNKTYGKDLKLIANKAAILSGLFDGEMLEKNSDPSPSDAT